MTETATLNRHYVLKTGSKNERIQEILDSIDNAFFLSSEDIDRVEHVDMSWSRLWKMINELADMAKDEAEDVSDLPSNSCLGK